MTRAVFYTIVIMVAMLLFGGCKTGDDRISALQKEKTIEVITTSTNEAEQVTVQELRKLFGYKD